MVTSWISHRWLSPHSPELPIGQIVDRKFSGLFYWDPHAWRYKRIVVTWCNKQLAVSVESIRLSPWILDLASPLLAEFWTKTEIGWFGEVPLNHHGDIMTWWCVDTSPRPFCHGVSGWAGAMQKVSQGGNLRGGKIFYVSICRLLEWNWFRCLSSFHHFFEPQLLKAIREDVPPSVGWRSA